MTLAKLIKKILINISYDTAQKLMFKDNLGKYDFFNQAAETKYLDEMLYLT